MTVLRNFLLLVLQEWSPAERTVRVLKFVDIGLDPLEDASIVEQVVALRCHANGEVIILSNVLCELADTDAALLFSLFEFEYHLIRDWQQCALDVLVDPSFDLLDLLLILLVFLQQLIVPCDVHKVLVSDLVHRISEVVAENEVRDYH